MPTSSSVSLLLAVAQTPFTANSGGKEELAAAFICRLYNQLLPLLFLLSIKVSVISARVYSRFSFHRWEYWMFYLKEKEKNNRVDVSLWLRSIEQRRFQKVYLHRYKFEEVGSWEEEKINAA